MAIFPIIPQLLRSPRTPCMTWRVNLLAQERCAVAMGANVLKTPTFGETTFESMVTMGMSSHVKMLPDAFQL